MTPDHAEAAANAARILSDLAIAVQDGPQAKEKALAVLAALSKAGARIEADGIEKK